MPQRYCLLIFRPVNLLSEGYKKSDILLLAQPKTWKEQEEIFLNYDLTPSSPTQTTTFLYKMC